VFLEFAERPGDYRFRTVLSHFFVCLLIVSNLSRRRGEQLIVEMKKGFLLAFFLILVFSCVPRAAGQQRKVPQEKLLRQLLKLEQKLTPEQIDRLSSGFGNYLALAHLVLDPRTAGPDDDGRKPPFTLSQTRSGANSAALAKLTNLLNSPQARSREDNGNGDVEQISDPRLNFQLSRFTGFTENTSSSAWCGRNVVTGFQSTLASLLTSVLPFEQDPNLLVNSATSLGVAFSTNDGESFTDLGVLNPGPTTTTINTVMFGNPVVACTSPNKFYYLTSPFFVSNASGVSLAGVGLSVSRDGGRQWGNPVPILQKDGFHILDRAWLAADPHDSKRLYATYFDFDLDGVFVETVATARCPKVLRQAIELVSSSDGGQTWSSPSIVREDCDVIDPNTGKFIGRNQPFAPQVAVGAGGNVFLSYTVFLGVGDQAGTVVLNFRRSSDHGKSFDPEVSVSNIVESGDVGRLQGDIVDPPAPAMAADYSSKRGGKDTLYIAWADGRDNPQVDVLGSGTYNFGDILLAKSTDGGSTWSTPKPVSPTPDDFAGIGRDQFQPAIAVNRDGALAVCYYDKRNDPQNNAVDRFCSLSRDHGRSFHDIRQTVTSWAPIHATDFFLDARSLGLYDTVAPHLASEDDDGFFGSFQIINNAVPGVYGRRIRREE
jgi:hypothetical protein